MGVLPSYPIRSEVGSSHVLEKDDILLAETEKQGTGVVKIGDLWNMVAELAPPMMHRNYFRGKNLGSEVTKEQIQVIRDGSFKGLLIGDYWEIDGITWRIADFDYWYGTSMYDLGSNDPAPHHAVIMPDSNTSHASLNTIGSALNGWPDLPNDYTSTIFDSTKNVVTSAFGDYIIRISHTYPSAFYPDFGATIGYIWRRSVLDFPDENMLYGHTICSAGVTTLHPTIDSGQKTYPAPGQLALMRLAPRFLKVTSDEFIVSPGEEQIDESYWIKNIASSTSFCICMQNGEASYDLANHMHGLRPVFAIG